MAKKKEEETKEEKEFVVSFSSVFKAPRPKRARRAVTCIRKFIFKHLRVAAENVAISQKLNEAVWEKGREHIPRRIEIKVVKTGEKANVYLKGEKIEKPKKGEKAKEKKEEAKAEEKKKGEKPEEKALEEEIKKKKEDKKAKEKAADATAIKRGTGKEGK